MIRKLDKEEWRLRRVIPAFLGGTVVFTLLYFLHCFLAGRHPPRPAPGRQPLAFPTVSDLLALALLAGLATTLFVFCFTYLMWRYVPRQISLGKKTILCNQGNGKQSWPYEKIARIRFQAMQLGRKEYTVMFLNLRDGKDAPLGVSKKVDLPKIVDFLRSKGVEVVEKT